MRHFVIATHGYFADGIMDSVRMILGMPENVTSFCAYTEAWENDGGGNADERIIKLLDSFPPDAEIVVLTDLLGGSVCNEFVKQIDRRPFTLLCGLNLPLLLELFSRDDEPLSECLAEVLQLSAGSIKHVNPLVESANLEDTDF